MSSHLTISLYSHLFLEGTFRIPSDLCHSLASDTTLILFIVLLTICLDSILWSLICCHQNTGFMRLCRNIVWFKVQHMIDTQRTSVEWMNSRYLINISLLLKCAHFLNIKRNPVQQVGRFEWRLRNLELRKDQNRKTSEIQERESYYKTAQGECDTEARSG